MITKYICSILHRKLLFTCIIIISIYFLFIFLAMSFNPKSNSITTSTGINENINKMKHGIRKNVKTTTLSTPLNILMNKIMDKQNISIEKFDAMKVYTAIMKRRIARIMERQPKNNDLKASTLEIITNNSVHMLYSDTLMKLVSKGKNHVSSGFRNESFEIVKDNLKLSQKAGAGVLFVVCSRLSNSLISHTSQTHHTLKLLFHEAPKYGIKVSIAIKDYVKRNVMSIRRDIRIFLSSYKNEKAFYTFKTEHGNSLPVIYIMSSFALPANEWSEILSPKGKYTIRNSKYNVLMLGELRDEEHSSHIRISNFDGFFTSHANNKEFFGSTWKNWQSITSWASGKSLLWSAGITEASAGLPAVGVALRTALRCTPRPAFVLLANVPPMDEYLTLTQSWLRKWSNASITDF